MCSSCNDSSSSAHLFLLLAAALCSIAYLLFRKKNGYRLPPGPCGLPIIGNLHMLGDLPHHTLCKLSKKYGPIMSVRLGLVPAVVVSSPEMAELFLKTHDIVFASRPKVQAAEYMAYDQKGLSFSEYGPYWRNIRKLCTVHLLSNSKIESFKSMRREEVMCVVKSIKDLTEFSGNGDVVVDVSEKLGCLMEDVTFRMVFGAKDDRFNLKPVIQEGLRIAGAFNLADYVPYIGALDLQGWTRRMKAVSKVTDESFEQVIEEHVQNAQKDHHQNDFVDVLLALMNTKDGQEIQLGRPYIKAIILDMFAGSMDTTGNTIEWVLSELLRHPRVMKLVQKELESVVGLNRMVEETDLVKLEYLEMVVEETDLVKLEYLEMVVKEGMRLHPVAPLLGPHESIEDININGYDIPKKSRVIVNFWAIGRDPLVWSNNADEFYPERFIGSDIDVRGNDFRLIPFGSGRRGCPGIQLGLTMVRLTLAQLVHCFNWELPNDMQPDELDMTEKFGLSVPRANHLLAIPTCRLNIKNL